MHPKRIETSDGVFTAWFTQRGLAALDFPSRQPSVSSKTNDSAQLKTLDQWHKLTTSALRRILAGKRVEALPPLDLSRGSNFQQRVWRALQTIPPGQTRTYSQLAREVGNAAAIRAVGGACGANPIPVLIPCHRVLRKGGALGGFSSGLDWKRSLLTREGVQVPPK